MTMNRIQFQPGLSLAGFLDQYGTVRKQHPRVRRVVDLEDDERALTLVAAFDRHPHRFKGRVPQPPSVPDKVYINPPLSETPASNSAPANETH